MNLSALSPRWVVTSILLLLLRHSRCIAAW